MEMPGREVRHRGQPVQVQRFGQVGIDVIDHAVDARDVAVAMGHGGVHVAAAAFSLKLGWLRSA